MSPPPPRRRCGQRGARAHFDLLGRLVEKEEIAGPALAHVVIDPQGQPVTRATPARLARLVAENPGGWREVIVSADVDRRDLLDQIRSRGVEALDLPTVPLVTGDRHRDAARLVRNRHTLPKRHWLVQHAGARLVRGDEEGETPLSDAALHVTALLGRTHPRLRNVLGRAARDTPHLLQPTLLDLSRDQLGSYLSWCLSGGSPARWAQLPASIQAFPPAVTSLSTLLDAGVAPERIERIGAIGTQVLAHLGESGLGLARATSTGLSEEEARLLSGVALARRLAKIASSPRAEDVAEAAVLRVILEERLALVEATPESQRVRLLVDPALVGAPVREWRQVLAQHPAEVQSCVISAAWAGRCAPQRIAGLVAEVGVAAVLSAKPASLAPLLEATSTLGADGSSMAWRAHQLLGTDAPRYLAQMERLGASTHESLYWLPLPADPAAQRSLGQFLLRQLGDRRELSAQMADARVAARGWEDLTPTQRTGSLRSVAGRARAAGQWGVHAGSAVARAAGEHKVSVPRHLHHPAVVIQEVGEALPTTFPTASRFREGSLTGSFLTRDDGRGLLLGELTDCCQHLGDAGRDCATHGQMSLAGGFFVVEDARGVVVAQSWVWRNAAGEVCFDNIEMLDGALSAEALRERTRAVVAVYQHASEALLETSRRVSIGRAYVNDPVLTTELDRWSAPLRGASAVGPPADYLHGYRDSQRQWVVAARDPGDLRPALAVEESAVVALSHERTRLRLTPVVSADDTVSLRLELGGSERRAGPLGSDEGRTLLAPEAGDVAALLALTPGFRVDLTDDTAHLSAAVAPPPREPRVLTESAAALLERHRGAAPPATSTQIQSLPPRAATRRWAERGWDLEAATSAYAVTRRGVGAQALLPEETAAALEGCLEGLDAEAATALLRSASAGYALPPSGAAARWVERGWDLEAAVHACAGLTHLDEGALSPARAVTALEGCLEGLDAETATALLRSASAGRPLPPSGAAARWQARGWDLEAAATVCADLQAGVGGSTHSPEEAEAALERSCAGLDDATAARLLEVASTHPATTRHSTGKSADPLELARALVVVCAERDLDLAEVVAATSRVVARSLREKEGARHPHAPGVCPTAPDDPALVALTPPARWSTYDGSPGRDDEYHDDYDSYEYYDDEYYGDEYYDARDRFRSDRRRWRRARERAGGLDDALVERVEGVLDTGADSANLRVIAEAGTCISCVGRADTAVRLARPLLSGAPERSWREQALRAVALGVLTVDEACAIEQSAHEEGVLAAAVRLRVGRDTAARVVESGLSDSQLQDHLAVLDLSLREPGAAQIALQESLPSLQEMTFRHRQAEARRRVVQPAGAQVLRSWREEWEHELADEAQEERERAELSVSAPW